MELQKHYEQTKILIEKSIFMTVISNTFMTIILFSMMINMSLYNFKINGIISYLLPQSVIKLLIIIYFGQLPSQELHHLVWRLRHRTMHWSAINWLCLLRLESMIEQFQFRLFAFFNITHQLLIAMVALILESLLLLVQVGSMAVVNMNTENSLKKYMNFFDGDELN